MKRVFDRVLRATAVACVFALTPAQAATGGAIRVYDSTEIAFDRYRVIKRLWVEDWRSAFGVSAQNDAPAARAALLHEAARLGADAVVNLYCLDRSDSLFSPRGHFCYGNAVKLRAP